MNLDEKRKFIINFVYFSFWTVIIYLIFKVAFVYLLPFLLGVFVAGVVQKPARFFSEKFNIKCENCASFLAVVCFLSVIGLFSLLMWVLYTQLSEFLDNFSHYSSSLTSFFESLHNFFKNHLRDVNKELRDTVNDFSKNTINVLISKIGTLLSGALTGFIKKIPSMLISIIVTVVSTCYISKDYQRLIKFLKGMIDEKIYQRTVEFKNVIKDCFLKFVIGYFWLFVITFLQLLLGLFILGIKHFVALAFLISILDLLPVIGTSTVLIPWALFVFLKGDFAMGTGLIILLIFIVVVRNFAEPKIIGKQIGLNPLFTLFFVFVGLRFGGVFGMLILPITLTAVFTYYRRKLYDIQSDE